MVRKSGLVGSGVEQRKYGAEGVFMKRRLKYNIFYIFF